MTSVYDHARHTAYSNPGVHATALSVLPTEPESLSAVARNVIVHYRASGHELPETTRDDINARWLEAILAADQSRHRLPLEAPRPPTERVQGCCRDHTLFCVGALRSHGVPARSRVGFAGYFVEGWHHDHVVVEAFIDGKWRRFDPEIEAPRVTLPSPTDIEVGSLSGTGFVTAAQVWLGYRQDSLDAATYGVDPNVPVLRGQRFIFEEVIYEVAHRFGDELLLWDTWGRMGEPGSPVDEADARWIDDVARLLLAADEGDEIAERRLLQRYQGDSGLHPGPTVIQASPYGHPPVEVRLER